MVSVGPSKSRPPLHDFPLPDWNWSKNRPAIANPLRRHWKAAAASSTKSPESSPLSAKLAPTSYMRDSDSGSDSDSDEGEEKGRSPASQGFRSGRTAVADSERPEPDARSKTLIRLCVKNRADAAAVEEGRARDLQESEAKTKALNLRPRKSGRSGSSPPTAVDEVATSTPARSESLKRLRNHSEAKVGAKEVKKPKKFEIPLSKQEIVEDIFVMTGLKPSRRPKKRSKAVQKQLDSVFPGLWLPYINPDSYTVPEKPAKKA